MGFTDSNTASCTIAADRAWANGLWPFATAVFTAITFQSNTTSALETADNNRAAINVHSPRILFFVPPCILFIFIVFLLIPHWLSVSVAASLQRRALLSISESVSRRYALCRSKYRRDLHLGQCFRCGVESFRFHGVCAVASEPAGVEQQPIRFGEGYELDLRPRRLRRGSHVLKLERIPFEILLLLLEHRDEIVTRDQIVSRVWGQGVFLDTDNSIRGAIRKLRLVLKDDAETPRFIQTVTGQGYRFIALVITPKGSSAAPEPVASVVPASDRNFVSELDGWLQARRLRLVEPDEDRTAEKTTDAGTAHRQGNRKAYRWLFVGAVALLSVACLLSFLVVWGWRRASNPPAHSQGKIVLAVLPFENLSRDPEQDFFSEGLTEEMIAQIGKLNRDRLTVVARSSVAKYKGTDMAAKEIGKELNADYLVQGSVRRSSDRVRITVQLIQAQNQTDLWTESYDREVKDLFAVQDSVVQSIASQIHIALTEEQKTRLANPRLTRPEAYEAYLKGRYYWNKRTADGLQKALLYFQQAINKDPAYGAAYSGLADCNSGLAWHGFKSPVEALPMANAGALRAIKIDPQSAEAHASLGLVLTHRWDWAGAEAEFKQALRLDPRYANAHHWYGDYLSIMGRHAEALLGAGGALEFYPLNCV